MNSVSYLFNVIWTVLAVNTSRKYGKNPWLWGILSFFFGLLPLGILYINVGKKGLGITLIVIWAVLILIAIAALSFAAVVSHHMH